MADEEKNLEDAQQPPGEGPETPGPIPYARFKEVNDQLKELQKRFADMETEQKTANEKELAAQQKWQELAQKREAELKAERLTRLRLQAALTKGLPQNLAARLQGETEAELLQDAETLAGLLAQQTPSPPGVPPRSNGAPPAAITNQQMRDPKWVRENRDKIIQAAKDGRLPV